MRIDPILPIWLMTALCIIVLLFKRKGIFPFVRQLFIVVLLFLINLRIMIPGGTIESSDSKKDLSVLFVVDNTISMLATDYQEGEERLNGVKKDCAYIIDSLYGAEFSVITFDNNAKVLSPFTRDTEFAKNTINCIYPLDSFYAKGTSLNICKDVFINSLKELKKKEDTPVAVFFISDGEMTKEDTLKSFQKAAKYIDYGAVLGYGTKQGGKMYPKPAEGEKVIALQDETEYPYKDAISKINEKNLKQLAKDMNISYINMNQQKNIDSILKEIQKKTATTTGEGSKIKGYQDIYGWFVVPLFLLLLYDYKSSMQSLIVINGKAKKK